MAIDRIDFKYGTYADYEALVEKDDNTIYFTTNPERIYKGSVLYTANEGLKYLTSSEYSELANESRCNPATIYLIIDDTTRRLQRICVGYVLIGEAGDNGSLGFPYTFPIIF